MLALAAAACLLGWVIASYPELYRPLFAAGVISVLAVAALRWPNAAILVIMLFLPILGLIRRLFISSSGWPEADPLLLIGPVIALVLFVRAYLLDSRPLAPDLLGKLVLAFLALVILSVLNPLGSGLGEVAGAALMLTAIPLLWFFIGRAFPDRATIANLQYATAFLAAAIAIYGLCQTEIGFPSWDLAWIDVGGYTSLYVGEQVRGWGSLASASEYAGYLAAGMVFAVAALLDRRTWPLVLLPVIAGGILFSSVRGTLVLAVLALAVMLGVRSKRPRAALPAIAVAGLVAYFVAAPLLAQISSSTGSDLVSHQLGGIARPFDDDASTLDDHLALMSNGVAEGLRNPLGQGVAPAALVASGDLSYKAGGTEFDFSNAFVSFGLAGGILFLALSALALVVAGRRYMETRDPLLLGAIGLATVTLGYWLNGGHYALTPLVWLILGWATRPAPGDDRQQLTPG